MTKQYNNISVFKAKPSENPKAPQFNVVIEMADGTNYRGGLWEATSKAGTKYLRGSLDVDTGANGGGAPRQQAPAQRQDADTIDW
jgi:hypothetical protein